MDPKSSNIFKVDADGDRASSCRQLARSSTMERVDDFGIVIVVVGYTCWRLPAHERRAVQLVAAAIVHANQVLFSDFAVEHGPRRYRERPARSRTTGALQERQRNERLNCGIKTGSLAKWN